MAPGCSCPPKFKTKHRSRRSFRIPQKGKVDVDGDRIYVQGVGWVDPQKGKVDVDGDRIYVQGVGWVDAVLHRKPQGRLRNITVTVNPSGSVYASCLFEDGVEAPVPEVPRKPKVLGIDLNLGRLAVCSDGVEYGNPRALKQYEKKLRHKQKLLSPTTGRSSNMRWRCFMRR